MTKTLCFGSLNIDFVYEVEHFVCKGETISSKDLKVYSGGKGLNQSCALGKAGVKVWHAGMIGRDGQFLLDILKDAGVDTSLVEISDLERTGNAIIQNDSEGDNCIILYPGANHRITEEMADRVLSGFGKGDYLVLQNEISCLSYIMDRAKEKGMVIVLNPSPVSEVLTRELMEKADWMILNEIEAMQITGETSDAADDLAPALRKAYPETSFVLTLGTNGSCYIGKDRVVRQDIFPTKTVDTTAAGDTYSGFFIAGLINCWSIEESLRTAAKASSITVSRKGAAPSIPRLEEVLG